MREPPYRLFLSADYEILLLQARRPGCFIDHKKWKSIGFGPASYNRQQNCFCLNKSMHGVEWRKLDQILYFFFHKVDRDILQISPHIFFIF